MKNANSNNHNYVIKNVIDNNIYNNFYNQTSTSNQSNATISYSIKPLEIVGNLHKPSENSTNSNMNTNLPNTNILAKQNKAQNTIYKIEKLTDNQKPHHKLEKEKYTIQSAKRMLINTYKYWEGDNYFPLHSHIIYGPCSFRPTLLTTCIMTIHTVLFLSYSSKYFIDNLTVAIPIICIILYIISFIFLMLCSFTDPGIIRRFYFSDLFSPIRKEVKILQLGYLRNYKYCGTCGIIRPIRSTHCGDCNNCVERLDHHCPWVGNCVGKRNYKYFLGFIIAVNILTDYLIAFSIVYMVKKIKNIKKENDSKIDDLKRKHITAYGFCEVIMIFYVGICSFLSLLFTLNLLYYHLNIIFTNVTTKEKLKHIWENRYGNMYSKGCCYNINDYIFPQIKKWSIIDILRVGKEPSSFHYDEDAYRMVWKRNLDYSKMIFSNNMLQNNHESTVMIDNNQVNNNNDKN